jgi:alanyl-tRNA synthetase
MMKSSEIRSGFVDYFKKQGHTPVPSSSLIPENDPTLLFANAGMNQFKNLFLGLEKRDYSRAVSVQKCVRAGGKHNDLENVGFTARHHTFFEMLGNFSFGDYFKKEAIHFSWELLTKHYQIPKEKLYVTVFQSDDEAADLWHRQEGVPQDRIFRLGEKDNFWRMGDVGPCGPSSEIFFDHGPQYGKETDPFKGIQAGEDRFIEIWNLVFMQFDEKVPGQMIPLPKPSVDTGAGLERMVAALQGKHNNYNTDLFTGMIERACKISGVDYVTDLQKLAAHPELQENTAALRVLADHSRSAGFLIADGALPSNEGRGYVLRRILRRALRFGRKISKDKSILPAMVEMLITEMSGAYPELRQREAHIIKTIREEETRFLTTLDQGTEILESELKKLSNRGLKVVPGEMVFKLYDTFGFPVDLTRLMAMEKSFSVDETAFESEMSKARTRSQASWKGKGLESSEAHLIQWSQEMLKSQAATKFMGYEQLTTTSKVLGLSNGQQAVDELQEGQTGLAILDSSPFYAEGGGQVGDAGELKAQAGLATVVSCTKKNDVHLHFIQIPTGKLRVGDVVTASVQSKTRRNTQAHHSATHLLHAALRQVLGAHVTQAGSLVEAGRLRFDFTHHQAVSSQELSLIENRVNEEIGKAHDVQPQIMKHDEAIKAGALALFGEKYGDQVRVLKMGDFSCELCGGTHVRNTSEIRLFKIISEAGVSAGVRRIEAVTGDAAVDFALKSIKELDQVLEIENMPKSFLYLSQASDGATTSSQSSHLAKQILSLRSQLNEKDREIKKLKGSKISVEDLLKGAVTWGKTSVVAAQVELEDRDVLAQISDQVKNKIQSGIVVLLGQGDASAPLLVSVSKDLTSRIKAGDLLKALAAVMGGKGGGRPDFAQGAVPNPQAWAEAQARLKDLVKEA